MADKDFDEAIRVIGFALGLLILAGLITLALFLAPA